MAAASWGQAVLNHEEKAEKEADLLPRGEKSHRSSWGAAGEARKAPGTRVFSRAGTETPRTPEATATVVAGNQVLSAVAKVALPSPPTAAIGSHLLDSQASRSICCLPAFDSHVLRPPRPAVMVTTPQGSVLGTGAGLTEYRHAQRPPRQGNREYETCGNRDDALGFSTGKGS